VISGNKRFGLFIRKSLSILISGFVVIAHVSNLPAADLQIQQLMEPDPHAAHRANLKRSQYSVKTQQYSIPDVSLINTSGVSVKLNSILDSDKPVALNFIFTTCTTICPVMTATFAQMQLQLGEAAADLQVVSITIDPEYDRPKRLKEYAERFTDNPNWIFLTGDGADISKVARSVKAYSGSKMNHKPLTLLKSPNSPLWVRVDGLASGADLARVVTQRLLD